MRLWGKNRGAHMIDTSSKNQPTPLTEQGETTMRKVFAGLFMALDGVVQAPNEWQPGFDEEMGAALNEMLDGQDTILMGRGTFTEFAQYWPTSTDEPFASWINATTKHVFSSTLDSVDNWANSVLVSTPAAEYVDQLRRQTGGTIGVTGSPSLVRSLIDAQMLDELALMISPVAAGGGRARLFADDHAPTPLQLVDAKGTSSGAIIATYRPGS